MSDLLRHLAPMAGDAWAAVDDEARDTLEMMLAGRKLVGFRGPLGWTTDGVPTGRIQALEGPLAEGVQTSLRVVQPLVEIRVPFEVERRELDAIARGSRDANLDAVTDAAKRAALAEDRAIFHGYAAGFIRGVAEAATSVALAGGVAQLPAAVADALDRLRGDGVGGPFALALSAELHTELGKTVGPGGKLVLDHVRRLIDGPIVRADALVGGVVMSQRGDDFELVVGRDLSIGYLFHDATKVALYLEETFTFNVHTAEAAVAIRS